MRNLNLIEPLSQKQLYAERVRQACEKIPFDKLDPNRTVLERERVHRTLTLLVQYTEMCGTRIADIGCGTGSIALKLADLQAHVTAVDASLSFLQRLNHPQVVCKQAYIPHLPFVDASFDGLVLTDTIASIDTHLHRLTLSELARLVQREGWLLISTPLDVYSWDPDSHFLQLVETEFEVMATVYSYHRLHFHLSRWLEAPTRFVRAGKSSEYRRAQLQKRDGFGRLWFALNSCPFLASIWNPIAWLLSGLKNRIKNSRFFLLQAEHLSKLLWGNSAMTHMIVLARKKKMVYNV